MVAKLLGRPARADPIATLTERERSVLALMAEGLSNTAISERLFLSEGAISKYTTSIFIKLDISTDDDTNRRVRAVLTYLDSGQAQTLSEERRFERRFFDPCHFSSQIPRSGAKVEPLRRCRLNSQPEGDCRPAVPVTTSAEQRISRGGGFPQGVSVC